MQTPGTITTRLTRALLETIARRGADPAALTAKVGMSRARLNDGATVTPLATFTTILEVAAADRYDGAFGLKLGSAFPIEDLGPLAVIFSTSRTLGNALDKYTHYFPSIQSNTKSTLTISDGTARFSYSIVDPTVRYRAQDASFTLALEYAMLRKVLGQDWRGCQIDFEHLPGANAETYRTHFGCPVRFGRQENAISFPARYLGHPVPHSDSALNRRTESALVDMIHANESQISLMSGLEAWMTACFARSEPVDIEHAASDFGMSLRSFQRRLSQDGINYLDLRNTARSKVAKCMLAETNLPVTAIALFLGYSETSAFSRAFHQQVGLSPVAYRVAQPRH
jgi:AraC-like DNA-binding protein